MKVFIGTDHAGFALKEKLIPFLRELGYEVEDKGAHEFVETDDYPDFVSEVAKEISESESRRSSSASGEEDDRLHLRVAGIILGGSGQGEDMAADKFPHVRSAEYYGGNLEIVKLSREHNDANVLSLGARFLSEEEAKEAVKIFLETPFSKEERHVRRLRKFDEGY